jgi:hypothetical protein
MRQSASLLLTISVLASLLASCGDDCAGVASCVPELAVTITVSAAPNGEPVNDAVVQVSGAMSALIPCPTTQTSQTQCTVFGPAGTYAFEVTAPGYQATQRTVTARSGMGECGCVMVETQHLDVALVRSP